VNHALSMGLFQCVGGLDAVLQYVFRERYPRARRCARVSPSRYSMTRKSRPASTFLIARVRSSLHFLHGLLVGVVNSVWITSVHIIFFNQYIANHAKEAAMMKSMPLPDSPRLMMALVGPVIGVVSGLVLGVFGFVAGKFVKSGPKVIA
jgi:hypothetical protein